MGNKYFIVKLFTLFWFKKNDNEGDVDDAHDYKVVGVKGDSMAVHDKHRKDHVSENTCIIYSKFLYY